MIAYTHRYGGNVNRKGGSELPIRTLPLKEFTYCQWDLKVLFKRGGIEVVDGMGRFFVGAGQYIYKGGKLRLHREVELRYY